MPFALLLFAFRGVPAIAASSGGGLPQVQEDGLFQGLDSAADTADGYGIMPLAIPTNFSISLPSNDVWVGSGASTGIYSSAHRTFNGLQTGTYRFALWLHPEWTTRQASGGLNQLGISVDWYIVVNGQRYYALQTSTAGNIYFDFVVHDLDSVGDFGIGYEGYANSQSTNSSGGVSYRYSVDCKVSTTGDVYIYRLDDSYLQLFKSMASSLATVASRLSTINGNISSLRTENKAGFSKLDDTLSKVVARLDLLRTENHADLTASIANVTNHMKTLNTNLTAWFKSLNDKLTTEFVSLKNHLTGLFNSLYKELDIDFAGLLKGLTKDYDSSAGDSANSDLSGSLGGMGDIEGSITADASGHLENYDISSFLKFPKGLVSGLSLVTSFANRFLSVSNYFSQYVNILYAIGFMAILLGLWRFGHKLGG